MDPRAKSSPSTLLRRWRFQTAVRAARMLNAAGTRHRGRHVRGYYAPQHFGSG